MTDRVGETALTFLADVVHSQDNGTETHDDDGNNSNKRKAVESSGVASRWLPQSNLMPLNSGCTDDQESQEGEVIGEMKGMMPSATLDLDLSTIPRTATMFWRDIQRDQSD